MNVATTSPLPSGHDGTSIFITAGDGLQLHARCRGSRTSDALPVVCLPGLTRTTTDFDELTAGLAAATPGRRIVAVDYRGRGLSAYDKNPDNYSLAVELSDLFSVLTALDIGRAVLVGTSRGGLLSMLVGTVRPALLAGVVLNDIGPVIDAKGLARIKGYVGKMPTPRSFEEGAEILQRLFDAQFPKLDGADWLASARRAWREESGRLVPTYDTQIASTLANVDLDHPLPTLWKEFDSLQDVPLLTIRGANSDLLSDETVAAMAARRGSMETLLVPDQGHAPLLAEPDVIARIASFVESCGRVSR